jgi:hypothetical protein
MGMWLIYKVSNIQVQTPAVFMNGTVLSQVISFKVLIFMPV